MPRGKKAKGKEEEVEDDDIIEDQEDDDPPKPKKKSGSKRAVAPKKKAKKEVAPETDEDELSDLEGVEEDENAQDEAMTSRPQQRPRKVIDPETPIGELKTEDILSFLIQQGTDSLNPQLKHGALDLLHRLTGRRRRPPPRNGQGNFSGNNRPPPYGGGGNYNSRGPPSFRNRGGPPGRNNGHQGGNPPEQIYQDM